MRALEVEPRGPFDLHLTLVGTEPAFPSIYDGLYLWRLVRTSDGSLVAMRVRQVGPLEEPLLEVEFLSGPLSDEEAEEALSALCRFLCVHDDLSGAHAKMEADPLLRPISRALRGMMPWTAFSPLEGLFDAIIFQQISLRAAFSIIRKFVIGLGDAIEVCGKKLYAFPTPEAIAGASLERLRSLGLSKNKASYVLNLARSVLEGFDPGDLQDKPVGVVVNELVKLKGIGRWTAELFMATALKRWEVVPADDLGIRRAFASIYGFSEPKRDEIRAFAARWGRDAWPIAYSMLVWNERRERVLTGQKPASRTRDKANAF